MTRQLHRLDASTPVFSKPWKMMNYNDDKNAWKNKVWEHWSLATATINYNCTKKTMVCCANIFVCFLCFLCEKINYNHHKNHSDNDNGNSSHKDTSILVHQICTNPSSWAYGPPSPYMIKRLMVKLSVSTQTNSNSF